MKFLCVAKIIRMVKRGGKIGRVEYIRLCGPKKSIKKRKREVM